MFTKNRYESSYTNVFDLHFQVQLSRSGLVILGFLRFSALRMLESTSRSSLQHVYEYMTLMPKVNREVYVIYLNNYDILDLENVRIVTMQERVCIILTIGDKKGHAKGWLTLLFKVMQ